MKILIIDDHGIARLGIREVLSSKHTIVGDSETSLALPFIDSLKPDLITLEISSYPAPLEFVRDAFRLHPSLKILIVSIHQDLDWKKMELPIWGVFSKSQELATLLEAVDCIEQGRTFFPIQLDSGDCEIKVEPVQEAVACHSDPGVGIESLEAA